MKLAKIFKLSESKTEFKFKFLKILRKYIFSFILIIISINGLSQDEHLNFRRITSQDGLSQNWVHCIFQDQTGYMWFGTSNGLNRYDGYDFKFYRLGNVSVNAILRKNDHELWICNDLGVYIYDNKKDTFNLFPYLKHQAVICMLEDKEKKLWFGTNTGLYKFNPTNSSLVIYTYNKNNPSGISNSYINTLFEDTEGNLWIGTKTGLNLYQKTIQTFKKIISTQLKDNLSGKDITTICEDHNNRIWIGTAQDGVYLLKKDMFANVQFQKIIDGYIISLLVDNKNNLWIGRSSNGGLVRLNLNNFSEGRQSIFEYFQNNPANPKSLSDNSVFCLYQDYSNDIWIGTFGGGINFYSYRNKKFHAIIGGIDNQPSIKNNLVNAIWEEEKYLWIGTEGGLDRYNKTNKTSRHFHYESQNSSSLGANPVYSILKDSRGNLWIGTWGQGLNLYNYNTESFKRFLPDGKLGSLSCGNVFSIYEDSRGNLWIGTIGGGLNRYDYKTGKFKQYLHITNNTKSLYNDDIDNIKETKDGRLFISSYTSLEKYNYNTDDFTHYPINVKDTSSFNSSFIISIYEDSHKNIWIATNKGLVLFDDTQKFYSNYTSSQGLSDDIIQGISEDDHGNLWLGTNNGLSEFLHGTDHPNPPVFVNYTDLDGLSGNEFKRRSVFKSITGILYFGTSHGYTYFHPDSISLNKIPPSVVLSDMQLLQSLPNGSITFKSVSNNINAIDKVDLSYSNSDFVIKYAALNYLNPGENKYKYKLNGYDKEWIIADNLRVATYKHLYPGNYTFMVLGSNNDRIWNVKPKILQISIHPPWWGTWIVRILFALLFLITLIGFYRVRFSLLNRQKKKLEIKVKERTKELLETNTLLEEIQEEIIQQNNELYQHRNNLEQLIEKRTSELEVAKEKAEESDRLKTAFLHNMSHEIRTPLNAIMGFAGLLSENFDNKDILKNFTSVIIQSGNELLELVNDLLEIARIESGQLSVHLGECNLNELFSELETIINEYRVRIKKCDIAFELNLNCRILEKPIFIDHLKLKQILINLITNAFKFTHSGKVEVSCNLEENNVLLFSVSDTGIGISAENQSEIFERFTQADPGSTRLYGGTGLGLSIVKGILDVVGGKIWVNSEPGKGSTFHFTFPYQLVDNKIIEANIKPENRLPETQLTILIVEDDKYNAMYMNEIIKKIGYNILHAESGINAVDIATKQDIDLILMDIRLPDITGYEATRLIREQKPNLKIIAQTAYATSVDRQNALDAGCDEYISKPVDKALLYEVINRLMKNNTEKYIG